MSIAASFRHLTPMAGNGRDQTSRGQKSPGGRAGAVIVGSNGIAAQGARLRKRVNRGKYSAPALRIFIEPKSTDGRWRFFRGCGARARASAVPRRAVRAAG